MKIEEYRKKEGNRYYLQELNQKSGELELIQINLSSSTEPEYVEGPNEKIINQPRHDYYFTHDEERPKDPPEGIQWENIGYFE